MDVHVELQVPAPASQVWPHVERLDRYPPWMRLVHRVEQVELVELCGDAPAWNVELRARIGPFARSKRLRMARTAHQPCRFVRFERIELDGRDHAEWTLSTRIEGAGSTSLVSAELLYGGELWTAGILERVLEQEIRQAKSALVDVVSRAPTP